MEAGVGIEDELLRESEYYGDMFLDVESQFINQLDEVYGMGVQDDKIRKSYDKHSYIPIE